MQPVSISWAGWVLVINSVLVPVEIPYPSLLQTLTLCCVTDKVIVLIVELQAGNVPVPY